MKTKQQLRVEAAEAANLFREIERSADVAHQAARTGMVEVELGTLRWALDALQDREGDVEGASALRQALDALEGDTAMLLTHEAYNQVAAGHVGLDAEELVAQMQAEATARLTAAEEAEAKRQALLEDRRQQEPMLLPVSLDYDREMHSFELSAECPECGWRYRWWMDSADTRHQPVPPKADRDLTVEQPSLEKRILCENEDCRCRLTPVWGL